jgi:poly(3-hydroxybutyrate) depolymerase
MNRIVLLTNLLTAAGVMLLSITGDAERGDNQVTRAEARPVKDGGTQKMNVWKDAQKVEIPSTADAAVQNARFWAPPPADLKAQGPPVPLLVGLHTWSADYNQETGVEYLKECQKRGWVFIHPDFRGPNRRPEACGSDLAVQDVRDAVAYARQHARVDEKRIYLVGASGGGYMAMVMAHRAPQVWAGVSAWVGISDLAAWHQECKGAKPQRGYYRDVEKSCGGPPGVPATAEQYRKRSPLFDLAAAKGVHIDLNAGIHDGHTGSVPISHTLRAFNVLAGANGCEAKKISEQDIEYMTREQKVPASLAAEREGEQPRKHKVLFRRTAGPARLTIFAGGHEIDVPCAINWLEKQSR